MDPKETELYFYILIIAVILAFIFGLYILSLLRYHKRLRHLHSEKVTIEMNTLERERKRISADIHDDIGPQLSNIKMRIEVLDLIDEDSKENRQKTLDIIDGLLHNVRRVSRNLNPVSLQNYGLVEAIRIQAEELSKLHSIQIELQTNCTSINHLSEEGHIHIYRSIQEAIHNAIRHGSPNKISIQILDNDKDYFFEVADDGQGFDIDNIQSKPQGLGLSNIRNRVDVLGGQFYMSSKLNNGTSISFTIPKEN